MWIWDEGRTRRAGRRPERVHDVVRAGVLAAAVALVAAPAGAADQGGPAGSASGAPVTRVSPYVRYTREHAQSAGKEPVRARPSFAAGRVHPPGAHYKR